MKITAVKGFPVRCGRRNVFIVKVETDDGLYGLGEGGMSGRELAMQGMIDHFAQFLVGMDPRRIEHIWQTLYRGHYFEGAKSSARPSRRSTSRSGISSARRLVSPSTNCSAARAASVSPALSPPNKP